MELNDILRRLPSHLLSLVIDQPYQDYTAQDHAVWRYVMRRNIRYLPDVAHPSYLEGLSKTGISIEEIPHMYGMNRILKEIGWAAVAVDGFIPPAAFMEFQAYKVLVIAADIRPLSQIQYTPAPDIIHEAAGHAPIIADQEYADYLRNFGLAGSRAFSTPYDEQIYEAIRHLSILKADPYSTGTDIEKAEKDLFYLTEKSDGPSEMSLLRNLHWWTVEYGLIGELHKPRIYGAGLLSSIGESFSCLKDDVRKLPYTIDARNTSFDITTRQPQLFVTPDFEHLNTVLREFEKDMAFSLGGLSGIRKAVNSAKPSTLVYSSGLQVSGVAAEVIESENQAAYVIFRGPVTLSYSGEVLAGHGIETHSEGFGSPVGKIKGSDKPPELMDETELSELGIKLCEKCRVVFESGVEVAGTLTGIRTKEGKTILLSFTNCKVKFRDKILFKPEWGRYDMALGQEIISAFSGVADPEAFQFEFRVPSEKTHKLIHTEAARKLHNLYREVRSIRTDKKSKENLPAISRSLLSDYPDDWLLLTEIQELIEHESEFSELRKELQDQLDRILANDPTLYEFLKGNK